MKNFFRGIVFAIIALALGGWLYLRFGFADMCANVAVSRFDSVIASTALHASAARLVAPGGANSPQSLFIRRHLSS